MRILEGRGAAAAITRLINRGTANSAQAEAEVRPIIEQVRNTGDRAIREYSARWDGLRSDLPLQVAREEIKAAWEESPQEFRSALRLAARNIRKFAQWQMPKMWRRPLLPGVSAGQIVRPLGSVGCYVPGGRYPLPSTLLMTVILAQVAGVKEIVVVSPRPARATLAAAGFLGVEKFYRAGGAQAIAALAYGTETFPRVDKITGPGNRYVTAAKKLVAFDCAIDFLAGPTEIVILCDRGEAGFIAADLVAQAEHDSDALPIFITTSRPLAAEVSRSVTALARGNPTAKESLGRNGLVLIAKSRGQSLQWANAIAPEHITIQPEDADHISSAGSVFLGDYSAQVLGDYCSGPNHVLPTGGAARYRGGLSVLDFVKIITVQQVSRAGLNRLASCATGLSQSEGLRAHAQSIYVRRAHA